MKNNKKIQAYLQTTFASEPRKKWSSDDMIRAWMSGHEYPREREFAKSNSVEDLADNIKAIMKAKHISAYKLQKLTKMHKANIYAVLQYGSDPNDNYNIQTLFAILKALKLELKDVVL